MYIPKYYQMNDKNEYLEFMKRYSFATIITSKDSKVVATHLPFSIDEENEKIILYSHLSKANLQWKDIENNNILVIFQEPHVYISPTNYENPISVPTWNYIAVHAYGKGNILEEYNEKLNVLAKVIQFYEKDYYDKWLKMPDEYKKKMLNGIVAFSTEVTKIKAVKKLSQDKSVQDQKNIIKNLGITDNEKVIGEYMSKNIHL